jgi:Ca2+-binding EF-hand superfamily protein
MSIPSRDDALFLPQVLENDGVLELPQNITCYSGSGDPDLNDFRLNMAGVSVEYVDAAAPVSAASQLRFLDTNTTAGGIAGKMSFIPAATTLSGGSDLVDTYIISFGDAARKRIKDIGTVQKAADKVGGSYQFMIVNEELQDEYVYLLVTSFNHFFTSSTTVFAGAIVIRDVGNPQSQFLYGSIGFEYDGNPELLLGRNIVEDGVEQIIESWAVEQVIEAVSDQAVALALPTPETVVQNIARIGSQPTEYALEYRVRVAAMEFADNLGSFLDAKTADDVGTFFTLVGPDGEYVPYKVGVQTRVELVVIGVEIDADDEDVEIDEGSSTAIALRLSERPDGDARLILDVENESENVVVFPRQFTFTEDDWYEPQLYTVTVEPDDIYRGNGVFTVKYELSGASNFSSSAVETRVSVKDDDTAGVTVSASDDFAERLELLQTDGGASGASEMRIKLTSEPLFPVVVTITPETDGIAQPVFESVLFTPGFWDEPETIDVFDLVADDVDTVQHTTFNVRLSSEDPAYNVVDESEAIDVIVYPHPPVVESVRFSSNAAYLYVDFDKDTTRPDGNGDLDGVPFSCSVLFVNATALFGEDGNSEANCEWTTARRLSITLAGSALVQPALAVLTTLDHQGDPDFDKCLEELPDYPAWQTSVTFQPVVIEGQTTFYDHYIIAAGVTRDQTLDLLGRTGMNKGSGLVTYGTTNVLRPLISTPPNVVISGRQNLGECDDLSLNTYTTPSSGGRDFVTIDWSVESLARTAARSSLANLTVILDEQSGQASLFVENGAALPVQRYLVTVRMTNFLCDSGVGTLQVDKQLTTPPIVTLLSVQHQRVTMGSYVRLAIDASPPKCPFEEITVDRSLGFEWLQDGKVFEYEKQSDPKLLLFQPYDPTLMLTVNRPGDLQGVPYKFSIRTFLTNATDLVVVTDFEVVVKPAFVVANIVGGDRSSLLGAALEVDASLSRDFNVPHTAPQNLRYSWRCVAEGPDELPRECSSVEDKYIMVEETNSILRIPASLFTEFGEGVQLTLSVCVQPADHGSMASTDDTDYCVGGVPSDSAPPAARVDQTSIVVSLMPGIINGEMQLKHLYGGSGVFLDPNRINPADRVVLQGNLNLADNSAYTQLMYEWTSEDVDISAQNAVLTAAEGTGIGACDYDARLRCVYLVVASSILVAGRAYTFTLGLEQQFDSGADLSLQQDITVSINLPPTGGQMSVSPVEGFAITTPFSFFAVGWTDFTEDLPLTFAYSYSLGVSTVSGGKGDFVLTQYGVETTTVQTLPYGNNSTITVFLSVRDRPGAEASRQLAVRVNVPVNIDVGGELGSIDDLLQEVNVVQALVKISQIGNLLNDDQANTTASLTLSPTAAGGRRLLNTTAIVSTRGRLLKQATTAQKQVYASRENVALQTSSAKLITFAGDLDADTAQDALDYINNISAEAFNSKEIDVLSSDAAQATVDTVSNLFLAGVQSTSSSIGTIHDILNRTTSMQAGSLVLGENPVETVSDNLIVQARRVSISASASAAVISLDSTGSFSNGTVNPNVAATFNISASDTNVGSVTSSLAVFKQTPYEFAAQKNAGIASAITSLELQSTNGPVTEFPGGGVSIAIPVTHESFVGVMNGDTVVMKSNATLHCVANSTVPANLENITRTGFECPDGSGYTDLSCNGTSAYTKELECTRTVVTVASCVAWDAAIDAWSGNGCVLANQKADGTLECECEHLSDYAAEFAFIGTNFLETAAYFDDITFQDLIAALPALLLLTCLVVVFATLVIISLMHMRSKRRREAETELLNPNSAGIFQAVLQEENIAKYLVRQAVHFAHQEAALDNFLMGYDEVVGSLQTRDASVERRHMLLKQVCKNSNNGNGLTPIVFGKFLSTRKADISDKLGVEQSNNLNSALSNTNDSTLNGMQLMDSSGGFVVPTPDYNSDVVHTSGEIRETDLRALFALIDDSQDGLVSGRELYQFVRMMNPHFNVHEVDEILDLMIYGGDEDHNGQISCEEFVHFFMTITSTLTDERFDANLRYWAKIKRFQDEMKLVSEHEDIKDILENQAKKWERAHHLDEHGMVSHEGKDPPPLFEPVRDAAADRDDFLVDEVLIAKQLVEYKISQLDKLRDFSSNFFEGMKSNHPVVTLFTEFTEMHRHQQIMVLWVGMCSEFFIEALLFDFEAGGKRGDLSADEFAANAALDEGINTDWRAQLEAYAVFGILGGIAGSIFSVVVVTLFLTAMRKEKQVRRFEELAKHTITKTEDLSDKVPVEELQYELSMAVSRQRLGIRHYEYYKSLRLRQKRIPIPKDFILGILEMNIAEIKVLLESAKMRRQEADWDHVDHVMRITGSRGLKAFWKRRAMWKDIDKKHEWEELEFHLEKVSLFERQLYIQNLRAYEEMGIMRGYMFWSWMVDDDEKFEVIADTEKGRTRNLVAAWTMSILWSMWCIMYTLAFLFRADDVDPITEEQLLDPVDFMKAFGVGVLFDFFVFTPFSIFWRVVIIPGIIVWFLGGKVSAHFHNQSPDQILGIDQHNFADSQGPEEKRKTERRFSVTAFQNTLLSGRESYDAHLNKFKEPLPLAIVPQRSTPNAGVDPSVGSFRPKKPSGTDALASPSGIIDSRSDYFRSLHRAESSILGGSGTPSTPLWRHFSVRRMFTRSPSTLSPREFDNDEDIVIRM